MSASNLPFLEVTEINEAIVVRFVDRKVLNDHKMELMAKELFALADTLGTRELRLDFGNVEYLQSSALGKLIGLAKNRVDAADQARKEWVAEEFRGGLRDDKADGIRPPRHEAARRSIRRVPQAMDRALDDRPRRRLYAVAAVDHAGDGRSGNPRGQRDGLEGLRVGNTS